MVPSARSPAKEQGQNLLQGTVERVTYHGEFHYVNDIELVLADWKRGHDRADRSLLADLRSRLGAAMVAELRSSGRMRAI